MSRDPRQKNDSCSLAADHFKTDYYGRPRFEKYLSHFPAEGVIADFGCRDGVFLNLLRDHGREGLGIDRDPELVKRCREFGLSAVCSDVFEFVKDPGNEGKFSGIFMADFVEHFDPTPLQDLLGRSVLLLRPGGALVMITPNTRSLLMCTWGFYEANIEHHNTYSILGLQDFLEKRGMEAVARGTDRDSRAKIWSLHPLRLARNLAFWALGRVICGKDCLFHDAYLVMRRLDSRNQP